MRKNGQLWQPIHISMPGSIPNDAVVKVDGASYSYQPLSGTPGQIEVLVPRVQSERKAIVTIEGAGNAGSATVTLKPVRKVLVYVLPHSHHDLGYTELQAHVEEKQIANIDRGMELARKTADYADGA